MEGPACRDLGFPGVGGSWSEIIYSTCNRIQYHRNHSHGRVMVILTRETSGSVDLQLASFCWLVGSRTSDSTFDGARFAWVTTFSQAGGLAFCETTLQLLAEDD